jgi:hypothetical protein
MSRYTVYVTAPNTKRGMGGMLAEEDDRWIEEIFFPNTYIPLRQIM